MLIDVTAPKNSHSPNNRALLRPRQFGRVALKDTPEDILRPAHGILGGILLAHSHGTSKYFKWF